MSPQELMILALTAISVGFIHVIMGPDHYVPFIVMAKAQGWSKSKTFFITMASGAAHILSSVLLGVLGIGFGVTLAKLNIIESLRGDVAGWALIAFGLAYFVWGLRRVFKNQMPNETKPTNMAAWILFTIFIFGPCEPLIPIMMAAAAKGGMGAAFLVSAIFGSVTIAMMLGIVFGTLYGLNFVPVKRVEKYAHAFAGLIVCLCGVAIQFLGL